MKHLSLSACLLFATLSACNGWSWGYQRGVGFTGIDGEPASVEETATGGTATVSRAVGPSEALAALPPVSLQAEAASRADQAAVAIASGGRTPADAVLVSLDGTEMMLSTVRVNGQLFAVLRLPEGQRGRMAAGSGPAFAAAVPRLTGCLADGGAYDQGKRASRAAGLAVALDCR